MKFKTQWNAKEFPKDRETNDLPSLTLPDQTMSMRTILDRYARGLPIGGHKTPIYNGDEDLPELDHMDLAERQELLERNKERIQELREKAVNESKRKKEAVESSKKAVKQKTLEEEIDETNDEKPKRKPAKPE